MATSVNGTGKGPGGGLQHGQERPPRRILLLTENFPPVSGGSGRWFWELYRRLPAAAERVFVVAGAHLSDAEFDATHHLPLVRFPLSFTDRSFLNSASAKKYLGAVRALAKWISTKHIDVVHCGRCLPEGWIGFLLYLYTGIPFVCYVHGEDVNCAGLADYPGMMSSRQHRWMTRLIMNHASLLIPNSRNSAAILEKQWQVRSGRMKLMHPGVDCQRFAPAPYCADTRARLGWGDRLVLLTVGRLQKRKGHDSVIRALPLIRERFPSVLYAIAGSGTEQESLTMLVQELGLRDHVQFMGEVNEANLVPCFQQCDLFILANRQIGPDVEGFGIVLLEAQACGKPVLAGASGGTAETMRVAETGRVLDCQDAQRLASTVMELLGDPATRSRMGALGRQWVLGRFDWTSLTRQASALFGN